MTVVVEELKQKKAEKRDEEKSLGSLPWMAIVVVGAAVVVEVVATVDAVAAVVVADGVVELAVVANAAVKQREIQPQVM